jgi:hypothetical protein
MDERERNKFYSTPDATTDDGEYEIEPPDPNVLSAEDRHGQHVAESARQSIDIDEIYREADRNRGAEILEEWVRNFRFRFEPKYLLIATALLVIVLALATLLGFWPAIFTLIMFSVGGLYSYLKWEEGKQQAEAQEKREAVYAERRARLRAQGIIPPAQPVPTSESRTSSTAPTADEADDIWHEPPVREPFRFRFSMQTMLIAMTTACVFFGLIRLLGGPENAAAILGLLAVAGLAMLALGYDPPPAVILGWWFVLALYVLVTIVGAAWVALA